MKKEDREKEEKWMDEDLEDFNRGGRAIGFAMLIGITLLGIAVILAIYHFLLS